MMKIGFAVAAAAAVLMTAPSLVSTTPAKAKMAQGVDVQLGRDRDDRDRRRRNDSDVTIGVGPSGVTVGPRQNCREPRIAAAPGPPDATPHLRVTELNHRNSAPNLDSQKEAACDSILQRCRWLPAFYGAPPYSSFCAGPSSLVTVRAPAWARSLPGRSMRWWMAPSAERSLGGSTTFSRRVRRNSARRGNSSPALM